MVKAPIFAKTRNICHKLAIFISFQVLNCLFEHKSRKNIEKKVKNIWRLKKCPYLCSPFEKQRYLKRHKKFIEKIEGKYKKQVPRNTIYREALILLKEL